MYSGDLRKEKSTGNCESRVQLGQAIEFFVSQGLTARAMGTMLDISEATVRRIKRGDDSAYKRPDAEFANKLTATLLNMWPATNKDHMDEYYEELRTQTV